jgi:hypothetical protein
VAALVWAVSLAGCKKEEPAPAAPPVAQASAQEPAKVAEAPKARDAGTAAAEAETPTPFNYKNVKLAYAGGKVTLSYTLENQGRKRARGATCLWLHDKDGEFIDRLDMGPISLKGGESDVFEDTKGFDETLWKQVSTVQLYAAQSCYSATLAGPLSTPRRLDTDGRPPLEDVPPARRSEDPEAGTQVFRVKDVKLSQESPSDSVSVTFTVTNTGSTRAKAEVCVRLYDAAGARCELDGADADSFNLAPGASETFTSSLSLGDDKNWDAAVQVRAFASQFGCLDKEKEALSNIVAFPKPDAIQAPREEEETVHGHSLDDEEELDGDATDGPVAEPAEDSMQVDDMSGESEAQAQDTE